MKKLLIVVLILLAVILGWTLWGWDSTPPVLDWSNGDRVGADSIVSLRASDSGKGLSRVTVDLVQGDVRRTIFSRDYPAVWFPWGAAVTREEIEFAPGQVFPDLKEGEFKIEVTASDQGNWGLFDQTSSEQRSFTYDRTPPRIEVLSAQHYLRQGGSEAVLYRVSADTVDSGVFVGEQLFRGYAVDSRGEGARIGLFALPYDQPVDSPVALWARDSAGNESRAGFWLKIFPVRFRSRTLEVSDAFINKVVPEILSQTDEVSAQDSVLKSFIEINGALRRTNHQQLKEITAESAAEPLWVEPFLQLSNSQVEAAFADQRTYLYQGREIDRQTHLGFDLASLAQSPVEASNAGIVVFADYLGIYGNCVIIDHGLGLFSLYGHLSSLETGKGDRVKRGQSLGRTGQTGLAGGDHLHFSMVLQGVQVNPIEWWDEKWIRDHLLAKLAP